MHSNSEEIIRPEFPDLPMTEISENLNDLDVRNLPGLELEDREGNIMTVWYVDLKDSMSPGVEDPESPEVLLRDGDRELRMPLEELKREILRGHISQA